MTTSTDRPAGAPEPKGMSEGAYRLLVATCGVILFGLASAAFWAPPLLLGPAGWTITAAILIAVVITVAGIFALRGVIHVLRYALPHLGLVPKRYLPQPPPDQPAE